MTTTDQITATATYQQLIKKTPFLAKMLLSKPSRDSIDRMVYQLQKLGMDYLDDKNLSEREVKIAKQIVNPRP